MPSSVSGIWQTDRPAAVIYVIVKVWGTAFDAVFAKGTSPSYLATEGLGRAGARPVRID